MAKILIANWKMNPDSPKEAIQLAKEIDAASSPKNVEVVIAPPAPFLIPVQGVLKNAKLGAQNVFWEDRGAYTGEVSPRMLAHIYASHVVVGHSERREHLKGTDEMVSRKVSAVLRNSLVPVLCVGEPERVRKKGLAAAKAHVVNQLKFDLKNIYTWYPRPRMQADTSRNLMHYSVIIAYEPVWAIGTGRADKPKDTLEMVRLIKEVLSAKPYALNPRVLYGGSANSKNAREFLRYEEIDGALIGGASLKSAEFKKIIDIAAALK